ncbi:MAG: hypothetical protein ABSE63_02500 [Thermoguttaceae bacterium]|jgi:hypothetical protein
MYYQIYQVQRSNLEAIEPLGTKPKYWYRPGNLQILFKVEARDTGEDWAEKISCQLCELIGLPHVHYELGEIYDGNIYSDRGVICETCSPSPSSLILGNQLLLKLDPAYPIEKSRYKVREHTVDAVCEVLNTLLPPKENWMTKTPKDIDTAICVFVGYVMLDALIANQDRHHENWGAIQEIKPRFVPPVKDQHNFKVIMQKGPLRLAPSFDHGAALARNLSDEERQERLDTKDRNFSLQQFTQRAKSAFYKNKNDSKTIGTFDAFNEFARHAPQAAQIWLKRLATIKRNDIEVIINNVPDARMSGIAKRFTVELLVVNQDRLLRELLK